MLLAGTGLLRHSCDVEIVDQVSLRRVLLTHELCDALKVGAVALAVRPGRQDVVQVVLYVFEELSFELREVQLLSKMLFI